jgi:fructose-specific component phosphotransferase system IIB-like protein
MQINAVNKIEALFRRNYLNGLIQNALTPVLVSTAFLCALCIFVKIDFKVWYFLSGAIIFKFIYIYARAAFLKIDPKDCYRELDRVLDLKERAVTYYELKEKKIGALGGAGRKEAGGEGDEVKSALERGREVVISLVSEDFIKNYNSRSYIFDDASEFDKFFRPFRAAFTASHYRLLALILILSFINLYFNYYAAAAPKNTAEAAAEKKETPFEAAELLDALIESNGDKLKAADAFIELKAAREKLKEPQTSKELSKALKETADKLKRIKEGENKKGAIAELSKISEAADEMISGKSGAGLNDEDKKMLEERVAEFKKLVDDYLKNSNEKDFDKIEKELSELTSLLEAKRESMKKAAADNKAGGGKDGEKKEGAGAGEKRQSADEKSAMKHLNRMSGKELLEKLKNDKQLQELYAALSAMSDEADAAKNPAAQPGGEAQDGDGGEKDGKDGKEGQSGAKEGKDGKDGGKKGGGGGKITSELLGIDIPKPGKGSSNLKAAASDAPLMAPQNRQKAAAADKNAGQWKAFFEAERFGAAAQKSKVEGIHDSETPSMSIEGKSLPEPGAAETGMGTLVKSESAGADSIVSGDKVPDELKKPVGDYFKKLNNDFGDK